jgi:hypothetical protein
MRKIATICLALSAILFLNNNINAQAFQKGTINIDLGIGFGIYGTSQTRTYERSATIDPAAVALGVPSDLYNEKSTSDTTDGAVSTVIPLSFEYGISDKIGVGLDVVYNSYFINDSDRVNLKSVKAFDFGPKFSYHPLNSDFYDLSLGLGLGYSKITWDVASSSGNDYSGSGFYLNIDIKNKFWFSEHIGAYLNIGYKGNFYSAINRDTSAEEADLESNVWVSNVSIKDEFTFTMHGANIGIGLAVKF